MNLLILIHYLLHSSLRNKLFFLFLCAILGCVHQLTHLIPPNTPPPNKDFIVIRDYDTTWSALLRALDDRRDRKIHTQSKKNGRIVLEPTTVSIDAYCDCGKLGNVKLTGQGRRKTVVKLKKRAPRETLVEVHCDYSTTHKWKDIRGRVVRIETIPCVSSGRFEQDLYEKLHSYMSP